MSRPDGVTRLAIPDAGPLFEGHFPGRPILPGILLLHLALREAPLAGIEMLRFRRLVLPGERLEVHRGGGDRPDRASLAVRRGDERVAEAVLRLAPAVPPLTESMPPEADRPEDLRDGAAPDRLLPHGPPACFIEAIRSVSGDGVVCTARVPGTHPLSAGGPAPALVAIEMAAQAAGVFEARRHARTAVGREPGPRLGYLVGARGVRFARGTIAKEAACAASIRLVGVAGPLTSYDFEVRCGGEPFAAGRVSTWLTATAS